MRGDLQTFRAFDFSGGLDVKSSPLKLAEPKNNNRINKADHMVFTTSGAVTKRFATANYNTVSLGATVAITGGIQFRHSNGTDFILGGTDDGRLVQFNTDGTTANVKTGLTTGRRWAMDVYNDKVISVNGADVPRKWDGTTDAVLGGTPPATANNVKVHSNRVFMTDETSKSRLTWSGLNNEEDYCVVPGTRVLTDDLRWVPVETLRVGDGLLAFDEHARGGKGVGRQYRLAHVLSTGCVRRPVWRLMLSDGTSLAASAEHPWLVALLSPNGNHGRHRWMPTENLALAITRGARFHIPRYLSVWTTQTGFTAGYLSAAFDGEGWVNSPAGHGRGIRVGMAQNKNEMLARVHAFLKEKAIPFTVTTASHNPKLTQTHLSTLEGCLAFLGAYRPARLLGRFGDLLFSRKFAPRLEALAWVGIVRAEYLGEQEVIALESSAKTYFAEGFGAHNTSATNAGSMLVDPNNSFRLTGMVSASKSELILTKANSFYRLQGTQPSTYTNSNLIPAGAGAGGLSFQALLYALNDVWTLSADGIHQIRTVLEFGDLKTTYASERISPYFQPNTDFTASLNHLDLSTGLYDRANSRILWSVDTDGDSKNDLMLVYDTAEVCWSVWPGIGAASMWTARNASTGVEEVLAGGYDGFVRRLNVPSGSSTAIAGHVRHISHLNAPGIEKSPRHLFVYIKEEGSYTITVDTKFDFGATGGQTYSVSLLGAAHTLGVNWVLGVDPLGARAQIVKRLDLSGTGEYLEIGFKNLNANEPFTLQGYEVMWRPRRLIRRAS